MSDITTLLNEALPGWQTFLARHYNLSPQSIQRRHGRDPRFAPADIAALLSEAQRRSYWVTQLCAALADYVPPEGAGGRMSRDRLREIARDVAAAGTTPFKHFKRGMYPTGTRARVQEECTRLGLLPPKGFDL